MLLRGPDSIGKNYNRVSARKKAEIQFDSVTRVYYRVTHQVVLQVLLT